MIGLASRVWTEVGPDDLYDIRPPYFFFGFASPLLWLLLALLLMMIASFIVLAIYWPRRQLSAKSAYELALERLERARSLLREEKPMPYAISVSEAVRTYLSQRFHAPSTRRTTEEFLRQMESDRATPLAEHRELLRDFLQACDLVKFARYQPRLAELEHVQQRAREFVLATKPAEKP